MLRKYVFSQFTPFMNITLRNARNNDKLYPGDQIRNQIPDLKKTPKNKTL